MKLKIFLFSILLLSCFFSGHKAFADGDASKLNSDEDPNQCAIGKYGDTVYYIDWYYTNADIFFTFRKFGLYNKLVSAQTVKYKRAAANGYIRVEKILLLKSRIVMISSIYSYKDEITHANFSTISKNGNINDDFVEVAQAYGMDKKWQIRFNFYLNYDSSKIFVYQCNTISGKQFVPQNKFTLKGYDINFKKFWEKTVEVPYDAHEFSIKDITLSRADDVCIASANGKDLFKMHDENDQLNVTCIILVLGQDISDYKQYKTQMSEQMISKLNIKARADGHLICAAFVTGSPGSVKYIDIDIKNDKMTVTDSKIEEKDNDRLADKSHKQDGRYYLDALFLKNEGGAILSIEKRDIGDAGTSNGMQTYMSRNVAIADISNSGKLNKLYFLYKNQYADWSNDISLSGSFFFLAPVVYFLYNDNDKNEDIYNPGDINISKSASDKSGFLSVFKPGEEASKKIVARGFKIVPNAVLIIGPHSCDVIEVNNKEIKLANLMLQ